LSAEIAVDSYSKTGRVRSLQKRLIALVVLGLLIVSFVTASHFYWLDGPKYALLEILIGRTEYAPGYRESKFRRVSTGMTEDQVVGILGRPLRILPSKSPGEVTWFYTSPKVWDRDRIGADCCYTERVLFLREGVVTSKDHGFFID